MTLLNKMTKIHLQYETLCITVRVIERKNFWRAKKKEAQFRLERKASVCQQDGSVDKTVIATKYADLSLIPRAQMAEIKKTLLQAILRPTHKYVYTHIHTSPPPHTYQ